MSTRLFLSRPQFFRAFLAAFVLAVIALGLASNAHAQTETIIANIDITFAGMTIDSAGNLYGITNTGGNSANCSFQGCGTVFELSPAGGTTWTFTTIYNFQNLADGSSPFGGLVFDAAGNLYGTNTAGGTYNAGVAFELSPTGGSWTFTPLYSFGRTSQSVSPSSPLTVDKAGNLYGITLGGGRYLAGSAFRLSNVGGVWKESILHSFGASGDGAQPYGPLVIDAEGNLYGTTSAGGSSTFGTVFELSRQSPGVWKENLLYTFTNGGRPEAGLIFDSAHNLYGTTLNGGAQGAGGVFRLTRVKQNGNLVWKFGQIYSFTRGADGSQPASPLTFDASGNLYGTDAAFADDCQGFYGCWQVYKLSVGANGLWQNSALYPIPAQGDPGNGGLVLDAAGDIFGTSYDNHYFSGAGVDEVVQ
jgi:uncharacterized repeat protein (TIGR03803 family)